MASAHAQAPYSAPSPVRAPSEHSDSLNIDSSSTIDAGYERGRRGYSASPRTRRVNQSMTDFKITGLNTVRSKPPFIPTFNREHPPLFSQPVALNIWNIPPKEQVIGAHPLTENFSARMWEKAAEKRLDLHLGSEKEENEKSKMHVFRPDEAHELAREAVRGKVEQRRELEDTPIARSLERDRRREEEREQKMEAAREIKSRMATQRQKIYEDDTQRRRQTVTQRAALARKKADEQFNANYHQLKQEYQALVKEHVDPKLQRFDDVALQRRKELLTSYKMEITDKMHSQVLPQIDRLDAEELSQRRRDLFQKYIDQSNRKKIYLDEIDPSEYDPFARTGTAVKFVGGKYNNAATKGNDADLRLGEVPTQKERMKRQRELALASTIAAGGASEAKMQQQLKEHFDFKRQSSKGEGNPHMQTGGKNADLTFRDTIDSFWWPTHNFKNSQFYDRVLEAKAKAQAGGGRANPSIGSAIVMNEFQIPRGPGVVADEWHGVHGKGKRCLPAPGH